MEYYSAIKKEHIWVHPDEVDEPRTYFVLCHILFSVIQSEVSQKEKDKYRILTHVYRI